MPVAEAAVAALALPVSAGVAPRPVTHFTCQARQGTEVAPRDGGPVIVCGLGTYGCPGVEIRPDGGGAWDWSNVGEVQVAVSNGSDRAEQIYAAVVPSGVSVDKSPTIAAHVPPHSVRKLVVPVADDLYATDGPVELKTLNGKIAVAKDKPVFGETAGVDVFWIHRTDPHMAEMTVLGVETAQPARLPQIIPAASFFPFVDKYGQFRHGDWSGKIHRDEDFAARRA